MESNLYWTLTVLQSLKRWCPWIHVLQEEKSKFFWRWGIAFSSYWCYSTIKFRDACQRKFCHEIIVSFIYLSNLLKKKVLGKYVRHKFVSLCGKKLNLCTTCLIKIPSVQHSLEIGVKEQQLSVYRGCRPKVYE